MKKIFNMIYMGFALIFLATVNSCFSEEANGKKNQIEIANKSNSRIELIKVDSITPFSLSDDFSKQHYQSTIKNIKIKLSSIYDKKYDQNSYQLLLMLDSCYNTNFPFIYEGELDNFWQLYRLRNHNFWVLIDTRNHFRIGFGNEQLYNRADEVFPNGLMILDEYFRPELRVFIDTNTSQIALQNIDYSKSTTDHLNGFQLILKDSTLQHGIAYDQMSFETIFEIYNSYRKNEFVIDKKVAIHVGQDYGLWPCWDNSYCLLPWGFDLRDSIVNDVRTFVYSYSDFQYEK